jgi:hypothetical protein
LAAIMPIFCAIASCLPIGTPHCTRSLAQVRAICVIALPTPAQLAGSVRRPVLSVMSASLSPRPSPQMMFSRGTLTFLNAMTPFSIALRPMKRQRCVTSTPGHSVSTMNAVICLRGLPLTTLSGVRAITTRRSARVPLVHQSFSPLMMKCLPSAVGVAVVDMLAGSLPASTSVNANAVMAPFAMRGKYFFFCSSVPKRLSGWGTPMDWLAESNAVSEPSLDVTISIAFA